MKEARAFSPCHITGFFEILDQSDDPLRAGSKGAGVSLSQGVKTVVKARKALKTSTQIRINGSVSDSAKVSQHVLDAFHAEFDILENFKITIDHHVALPIGSGFGTSGAAALGLALALNEVFDLGISRIQAAQLAHITEIRCKTGLGTVIAETFGGLEIRTKPGAPGVGRIKQVPVPEDHVVVCLSFRSLPTKKFLTDENTRLRINQFGGRLVKRLIEEPKVKSFMKFSRQFAQQVGLMTDTIEEVVDATGKANFICSMPMFGESTFTLVEQESLPELLKVLQRYNSEGKIIVSEIDFEGAQLTND